MYDNLQWVDPYYQPFTKQEFESRYAAFLEEDAGNQKYIESGDHRIFENGAVWHCKLGRQRGPLPQGTYDYDAHRRKYIRAKERELNKLKEACSSRHNDLTNRIKHVSLYGGTLPESIEIEINEVNEQKKIIARKEKEFGELTTPERELRWEEEEFDAVDERRTFQHQDQAAELLKKLGTEPMAPHSPGVEVSDPFDQFEA